ncbi:hypothetical protein VMCG_08742 [Cytospora schulzeri]|uniref:Uncharacterized protein n=1 Tax=Cytospora schulzeri TaxID=448051 RepID=A0A423VQ78_9PEZI|nr:hypothetical protein VMCG_08742 [Valsa malicola]
MNSKFKSIFSNSSKTKTDSDPKPSYTKLQSSSDSIYSAQSIDVAEAKREAWKAKRAKDAEDYLWKHGFGITFPPTRI